jgi:hypothetical protein
MRKLAAVLVLGAALAVPSSAQADLPVVPGQGLQAFVGGLSYTPGSYFETEQVTVVNGDSSSNTTYPVYVSTQPTWCGRGGCNTTSTFLPTITPDGGCGTVDTPAALGPWDGQVDSTDSCTITYTLDLTGALPGVPYDLVDVISNLSTSAWGYQNATTLDVAVPIPPVSISTGDGTIDFGTGDRNATGSYDSTFAPAAVTVTKTTSTGAVKTVRHLEATAYGKHPWLWHGRNDAGARVCAGTYHLTVTVGGKAHTRKVVVR